MGSDGGMASRAYRDFHLAKKFVPGSSRVPGSAWAGQRINSTSIIHSSATDFLRNKLYPSPVIQS